jgi:hypothetical protein
MFRPGRSEYLVLRRTIAHRGSLRHILVVIGIGTWALTLTAVLAWLPYPVASAIPLLVLAATFEAIRPLHFGAERIGRYLQVFYEEAGEAERPLRDTPSWERVAMRFGTVPGVGGHPLFLPIFLLAIIVNLVAMLMAAPSAIDTAIMAVPHTALAAWLLMAHGAMTKQRAIELERMRLLLREGDRRQ